MRGTTVLELVVAMGVLSLMMAAILFIYVTGASAWAKGDAQAELLDILQTTSLKLAGELQKSSVASLTIEPGSLSCLSAEDPATGRLVVDPAQGALVWQRYRVFYRDAAQSTLEVRDVALAPGASQRTDPEPLAKYRPGQTNASFSSGGTLLARRLAAVSFTQSGDLVRFTLAVEVKRPRRQDPERVTQEVTVKVRN